MANHIRLVAMTPMGTFHSQASDYSEEYHEELKALLSQISKMEHMYLDISDGTRVYLGPDLVRNSAFRIETF